MWKFDIDTQMWTNLEPAGSELYLPGIQPLTALDSDSLYVYGAFRGKTEVEVMSPNSVTKNLMKYEFESNQWKGVLTIDDAAPFRCASFSMQGGQMGADFKYENLYWLAWGGVEVNDETNPLSQEFIVVHSFNQTKKKANESLILFSVIGAVAFALFVSGLYTFRLVRNPETLQKLQTRFKYKQPAAKDTPAPQEESIRHQVENNDEFSQAALMKLQMQNDVQSDKAYGRLNKELSSSSNQLQQFQQQNNYQSDIEPSRSSNMLIASKVQKNQFQQQNGFQADVELSRSNNAPIVPRMPYQQFQPEPPSAQSISSSSSANASDSVGSYHNAISSTGKEAFYFNGAKPPPLPQNFNTPLPQERGTLGRGTMRKVDNMPRIEVDPINFGVDANTIRTTPTILAQSWSGAMVAGQLIFQYPPPPIIKERITDPSGKVSIKVWKISDRFPVGVSESLLERELAIMASIPPSAPGLAKLIAFTRQDILPRICSELFTSSLVAELRDTQNPNWNLARFKESLASGIANAISYLHSMRIVHNRINPKSIMLKHSQDGQLIPVLCDFSCSMSFSENRILKATQTGLFIAMQMRYTAPELLQGMNSEFEQMRRICTISSDTFSYGLVLYEILVRDVPFAGMDEQAAGTAIMQGQRPLVHPELKSAFPRLVGIMMNCWEGQPNRRPGDMQSIVNQLI
eukprot:Partr_v1_DN28905_c0_g1_i10_m25084 putative protein kinase kinase kinase